MKALIVIDLQKTLCGHHPFPFHLQQIISNTNNLIRHASECGCPVIFIQHEDASTLELQQGSEGWQLLGQLSVPKDAIFVGKTTANSFLRTDLRNELERNNVNHLLICGYASEYCIDTTVRAAAALGYNITLISDAHTTHDKPHANAESIIHHENATLPELSSFGVRICASTTSELLAIF